MSIEDFVDEFAALGVRLWVEDAALRFRAPKGVMTAERKQAITARRAELLEYLATESVPSITPAPTARFEPFPLTDVQAAYLLGRHASLDYGKVACHAYMEIEYEDLDPVRFQRAWRTAVHRHDMLRAVVHTDGYQRVLPEVPDYEIAVVDVRGLDPEQQRRASADAAAQMSHRMHDPQQWPLFELRIVRGERRSVLHLSIDLLIADFVSFRALLAETDRLHRDPSAALPAPPVTFRDYVLAERGMRDGPGYRRDRDYWFERIGELSGAPELPMLPGTAIDDAPVRFQRTQLRLSPESWTQLRSAAAQHGVTAAGVVLAAFAEVIGRWSRTPRFTLDLTLLNRLPLHPAIGDVVGDFTSLSLLEVGRDATVPFARRAVGLQQRLWADLDHRSFSGVEVMREIARRRGRGAALMPIVFTSTIGLVTESPSGSGEPEGQLLDGITQTPQVWIDCQAMERAGGLEVNWDFRQGLFPDGLVEEMFGAFAALLDALRTRPDSWSTPSPTALPQAQLRRRADTNDTLAAMPEGLLWRDFLARVQEQPDRPAIFTPDDRATYGELAARAFAVAQALRTRDIRPGELVAVRIGKGVDQIAAVLGVLLAGAAYLPIDPAQPVLRAADILDTADVRVLLISGSPSEPGLPEQLEQFDISVLTPVAELPESALRVVDPRTLGYTIFTSGSSGKPKGVMISHRAALNTIADINRRFGVGPGDRVLGLAQLGFDLSVYDIIGPLSVGGALVLPAPDRGADPAHWADLVAEYQVTVWDSVPAQLQILQHYLRAEPQVRLDTLRLAMLSGDWIPVGLPDAIRDRLPELTVIGLGGATEVSIWSVSYPIDVVPPEWPSIPYGAPLTNQNLHILDPRLADAPDLVTGELYIGGIGVADGYLGDPVRTAARFVPHPRTGDRLYRTGDLARWLPDGLTQFIGRADNQVKIRGHRIEPAEVVTALTEVPAVADAAVVVTGEQLDRKLVAFAVATKVPAEPADLSRNELDAALVQARIGLGIDAAGLVTLTDLLDRAALLSMLAALVRTGVVHAERMTADGGAPPAPRHARLLRRWLQALRAAGVVSESADRTGRSAEELGAELAQLWARIEDQRAALDYGRELVDYFRRSCEHAVTLLREESDPVALLFPEGDVTTAWAAYNDNPAVRYANRAAAAWIARLAARRDRPLRVLEVGGGVGGTTAELLAALADRDVDYTFTDISQFYLARAEEQFGAEPTPGVRLRTALLDLERDTRTQGFAPNSFDVVVCGDVLHALRDVDAALGRIRELLVPGGRLVLLEAVREHLQALTSLEFMLRLDPASADFEDSRRGRDRTFLPVTEWRELLTAAGADAVCLTPTEDDPMARVGIAALTARFKADIAELDPAWLAEQVAQRLPRAMVPARIEIIDALPLTGNGKIDQARLHEWAGATAEPAVTMDTPPVGELETELAAIWAAALGLDAVGRGTDFFTLGGDSLLAAQIAGKLRDRVAVAAGTPFDELLRVMLEGPTVAELATELTSGASQGPAASAESAEMCAMVELDVTSTGPVRLFVHDGTGLLGGYQGAIMTMRGTGTALGLGLTDPAGPQGLPTAGLIDRAALDYVRLLDGSLPPGRPVDIIGCAAGAPVATEVARLLGERGGEVRTLVLVEPEPVALEQVLGLAADASEEQLAALLAELAPESTLHTGALRERYAQGVAAAGAYVPDAYAGDMVLVVREPSSAERWSEACLGQLRVIEADPALTVPELLDDFAALADPSPAEPR
ncbi:amino acid adenylation domain-containing protein [Nocardia sp. NPDC003979]